MHRKLTEDAPTDYNFVSKMGLTASYCLMRITEISKYQHTKKNRKEDYNTGN